MEKKLKPGDDVIFIPWDDNVREGKFLEYSEPKPGIIIGSCCSEEAQHKMPADRIRKKDGSTKKEVEAWAKTITKKYNDQMK